MEAQALNLDMPSLSSHLNPHLVRRQGLSQAVVDQIKAKHVEMAFLLEGGLQAEDKAKVVRDVEALELEMQGLWGFRQHASFHSHWFRIRGCTCPKDVNRALFGCSARVVSDDCPFHDDEPRSDGVVVGRDMRRDQTASGGGSTIA